MKRSGAATTAIDGSTLKAMLAAAADWLDRNAAGLDAINVFPVPDGDTGANMAATLWAAAESAGKVRGGAGAVLAAAAGGALLGARGNSGVILSQILAGLAEGIGEANVLDGDALARGLRRADVAARRAVSEPREGTILTVLSDTAAAAAAAAAAAVEAGSVTTVLDASSRAAKDSVARTPELLPILRQAGVVDAGGLGLSVVLEGCLCYLTGNRLPAALSVASESTREVSRRRRPDPGGSRTLGYCTEFMLEGDSLPREPLRGQLRELGDSVLVVGEAHLLRVHLHTVDPGAALSLGARHGSLSRIKIDNIDAQREAMIQPVRQPVTAKASVVAVAAGHGFEALLAGYGAIVVRGGQTLNPSTEEIISGIERAPGASVLVLPNNRNIIPAAEQAVRLAGKEACVIATDSIPRGIAALLAFNPERSLAENARSMEEAAAAVRTASVTRAARAVSIGGVAASRGQPIAIVDDRMVASAESPEDAAVAAVGKIAEGAEIATLYYGRGVSRDRAEACAALIRSRHAGLAVEVLAGGQPHYDYVISAE